MTSKLLIDCICFIDFHTHLIGDCVCVCVCVCAVCVSVCGGWRPKGFVEYLYERGGNVRTDQCTTLTLGSLPTSQ